MHAARPCPLLSWRSSKQCWRTKCVCALPGAGPSPKAGAKHMAQPIRDPLGGVEGAGLGSGFGRSPAPAARLEAANIHPSTNAGRCCDGHRHRHSCGCREACRAQLGERGSLLHHPWTRPPRRPHWSTWTGIIHLPVGRSQLGPGSTGQVCGHRSIPIVDHHRRDTLSAVNTPNASK